MTRIPVAPLTIATCALVLVLASAPLSAQTEVPATDEDEAVDAVAQSGISLGEPVGEDGGMGTTYVAAEHGDWQMTCIRTELEADPCQLYQLLRDGEGNAVAEVTLFNLPPGQEAAMGGSIVTPLETLLPTQITLRIDGGQAKRYPFTFCAPIGCISRVGFTAAEVTAFRRGNRAVLGIFHAINPDEQITLEMSLRGFTAGYEAVVQANDANMRAVEAAQAQAAPED